MAGSEFLVRWPIVAMSSNSTDSFVESTTVEANDSCEPIVEFVSDNGDMIGVKLLSTGDFEVGTWNADGSWTPLEPMFIDDFGNPVTVPLDQYTRGNSR